MMVETMRTYATRDDVEAAVIESLGDHAGDFDTQSIAAYVSEWDGEREVFTMVQGDRFWEVVAAYDVSQGHDYETIPVTALQPGDMVAWDRMRIICRPFLELPRLAEERTTLAKVRAVDRLPAGVLVWFENYPYSMRLALVGGGEVVDVFKP